jgi:hypothetical protein
MTIEMDTRTNYLGMESTFKLTVDFVAFLNFTTYQLDPSSLSNPMTLVQTNYLPESGDLIKVDPSWVLAAWAVDNNGFLYHSRTAAIQMVQIMDKLMPGHSHSHSAMVIFLMLLSVMQTLTLIDFTTDQLVESGIPSQKPDARHPIRSWRAMLNYLFGPLASRAAHQSSDW